MLKEKKIKKFEIYLGYVVYGFNFLTKTVALSPNF